MESKHLADHDSSGLPLSGRNSGIQVGKSRSEECLTYICSHTTALGAGAGIILHAGVLISRWHFVGLALPLNR
jgi:hypothetical protein